MGRARMAPGERGSISTRLVKGGQYEAVCWFREESGERRQKYATGSSGPKAEAALKKRLKEHADTVGGALTKESTINELADAWWKRITLESELEASTLRQYEGALNTIVRRELGNLRIGDATTQRLDLKVQEWIVSGKLSRARVGKSILNALFSARADLVQVARCSKSSGTALLQVRVPAEGSSLTA